MRFLSRLGRFGKTATDNRAAYRDYQIQIGHYYREHFVEPLKDVKTLLDVGCAEGGILEAFSSYGYQCTGLEFSSDRIEFAVQNSPASIQFVAGNIESVRLDQSFDVILMLDVIEHVADKQSALRNLKKLIHKNGHVIISFPPFRSAFGGHQQVMRSFLQFVPFLHLLPEKIYLWLLEHVEKKNVESHFRNYQTGITLQAFEKLVQQTGFSIKNKIYYFVRPRQAFRFGIKIRKLNFPYLKEYLCSGAVYILVLE